MKTTFVKIFLVLNLLLCAGALGFGVKVYLDREVLKARTVMLSNTAETLAENLRWSETVDWETAETRIDEPFSLALPDTLAEIGSFEATLNRLAELANNRVDQLTERHSELISTREELATTRETLRTRERELADARSEIGNLEEMLADVRGQLEEANQTISTLETEKSRLQREVESLESEIQSQDDQIASLESRLERVTEERNRIEALVKACQQRPDQDQTESDWHQRTAKILAIEPEWDYVVINKGEVDVLPMYLEAYVHRGDEFIGKVRVMRVERTVALAEILKDTLVDGKQIQTGDTIFF